MGPDHISYEVTVEDPKIFTRPWKMSLPLYRRLEANVQTLDYECLEFEEPPAVGRSAGAGLAQAAGSIVGRRTGEAGVCGEADGSQR